MENLLFFCLIKDTKSQICVLYFTKYFFFKYASAKNLPKECCRGLIVKSVFMLLNKKLFYCIYFNSFTSFAQFLETDSSVPKHDLKLFKLKTSYLHQLQGNYLIIN